MTHAANDIKTETLCRPTINRKHVIIIAVAGRMGSGKTHIAKIISNLLIEEGFTVSFLPFAKPLKDAAFSLGWDGKKDKRGRRFLQKLGTDCVREYDHTFWITKWGSNVADSVCDVVICDDLRFKNEVEKVSRYKFVYRIKMVRKLTWKERILNMLGLTHASERPLPDDWFDRIVQNDLKSSIPVMTAAMDAVNYAKQNRTK